MNARGVFDSLHDDDDQATMLYRAPRRTQSRTNFPPPVRAAVPQESRTRRSEMPPPAARRPYNPPPMRAPAITLESVPARAPRPSYVPVTESTPALAFDADSGEHFTRTPTVPVPRPAEARSKLPYLAAGVLALAAGALVVLLAGGNKQSYPDAWASGAAASSAHGAMRVAAAEQPAQPAAVQPVAAAQPVAVAPAAAEDRIYAAAFAASYQAAERAMGAPHKTAPVAPRRALEAHEAPVAHEPAAPKPVVASKPVAHEAPAPKTPKSKADKAIDAELSESKTDKKRVDDVLLDSL